MRLDSRIRSWRVIVALALATTTRAGAQDPEAGAVRIEGAGPSTVVLLSGLVGGVDGFARLRTELLRQGRRVVTIDAYRLSADSADVTFTALARRVDAVLARHAIDSACVVGHAHGGGVALRLAADAPSRVRSVYLLDVGALPENHTKVFSSSLRLVPFLVRIPGGRGFVRGRLVRGLEQNAGRREWIDDSTRTRYAGPLLDHPRSVIALAGRLAKAREPEPVAAVVARVRVPVTVLLGQVPHPAGPDSTELVALRTLGDRLRVETLPGVGHFPHEEAPADVARRIAPVRS